MISAARVSQDIPVSEEQEKKLEGWCDQADEAIVESSNWHMADVTTKIIGFFYDIRDAVSLINEQLNGV
jgi:hypothetical protein